MTTQILPLDPATYQRHATHCDEDRSWPETNCYVDLWIELLHAFSFDPMACMGFTLAMDFEGDQWTFFKPSLGDLYTLYGADVQELTIWRPFADHAVEQVGRGRPVLVEVDSFYLPDTTGVSYQIEHTKTTVAIQAIDPMARTLGYFHNAGYFSLSGDDFDGLFGLGTYSPPLLPPYAEFVKFDRAVRYDAATLRDLATGTLRAHLSRRPDTNPIARYHERFASDVDWVTSQGMPFFHQYAFATLRQLGACAEMGADFLAWLATNGEDGLDAATNGFRTISSNAKTIQFKLARRVATGKPVDVSSMFDAMRSAWDDAMHVLVPRYGS